MTAEESNKPTKVFWIVSVVALAWNLMGVVQYFAWVLISDAEIAALPVAEQALYTDAPVWATGAFAVAVFGGVLGCIGLLMRKKWSKPVFIASLAGVILQFTHWIFLSGALDVYGPSLVVMPILVVAVAIYLVVFSGIGIRKGLLG